MELREKLAKTPHRACARLVKQRALFGSFLTLGAQLGISLQGSIIKEIEAGGPAYISQQLSCGDKILKVNGIDVSDKDAALILANDVMTSPNTTSITVAKISSVRYTREKSKR